MTCPTSMRDLPSCVLRHESRLRAGKSEIVSFTLPKAGHAWLYYPRAFIPWPEFKPQPRVSVTVQAYTGELELTVAMPFSREDAGTRLSLCWPTFDATCVPRLRLQANYDVRFVAHLECRFYEKGAP